MWRHPGVALNLIINGDPYCSMESEGQPCVPSKPPRAHSANNHLRSAQVMPVLIRMP
jgi:hypothetical protein